MTTAERLWDDLREASPDADLVAEGRIVAAGVHADQGGTWPAPWRLLERSLRRVDRPQERHLRQWYVLADLAERAGDLPGPVPSSPRWRPPSPTPTT